MNKTDRQGQRESSFTRARKLRSFIWLAAAFCFSFAALTASAQTDTSPKTPDDLPAKSLPLRTALYHDPTLAAPLDRLLQIYREANRTRELLDLYRAHLAQYPADTGSQIVLLRLLLAAGDPEAGLRIKAAAGQFPDVGYLQFLLYQQLQSSHLAEALAALDHAIDKETLPARQRAWTELLIPQAMTAGRADLAEKYLRAWAARAATPDEKLESARAMITHRFFPLALETLASADALSPAAETGVEIQLTAATAEIGLNQGDAAGARLDKLLARLTADYWRRAEILLRRAALVKSDTQGAAMLQAARQRAADAPHDEAAALDLAQLLESFEQRRDALTALLAAGTQIPGSEKIERATLDLCDRLRDERARGEYLSARLKAQPGRQDLAALRVRTLFLLGRHGEALTALDSLSGPMDPAGRINYLLELARALRRSSLPGDAAEVFERVVILAPDRYEIRRELAETYLVLGKKDKARALFAAGPPADVPAENLGDVIGFMSKQGLLVEARDALAKRLSADPANFDLRLLALDLAGKLGDQAAGETLLAETRPLADTAARYRRWLEAGTAFAEIFDAKIAFFQAEAARLEPPTQNWTRDALEHHLAFIDVAANNDRKDDAQLLLRADLDAPSPPEMRVELRRKLATLLTSDAAQAAALQEQLAALTKDDPAHAGEYRVRQALAFQRDQRPDQALEILGLNRGKSLAETVDVGKISDPALLSGLESLLREHVGRDPGELAILQRLTEIDPTNRSAWERWITAQAMAGEEAGLRQTLRRLLAGIDRMPLPPDTRELLQEHLAASSWRSIHQLLNEDQPAEAALADALASLDTADSVAVDRTAALWVNWTRAYLLNRLGRNDARDLAVAELSRVAVTPLPPPTQPIAGKDPGALAADPADPPDATPAEPDAPRIVFPDGVAIALADARELLTARPSSEAPRWRASRTGPVGTLRSRWAFDTDGHATIVQILPLEDRRTLIADEKGQNYCLDTKTGKLLWTHKGAALAAPTPPDNNSNGYYSGNYNQQVSIPKAATDGAGHLLLPLAGQVECLSIADGGLLWRTALSKPPAGAPTIYPTVFPLAGKTIVCDPAAGQVSAVDPANGKLLWQHRLPPSRARPPAALLALNTGASLSGRNLLIYGASTAVLDVETGRPEWVFDPEAVRELPLSLKENDVPMAAAASPSLLPPSTGRLFRSGSLFSRGRSSSYGSGFFGGSSPIGSSPVVVPYGYVNAPGSRNARFNNMGNNAANSPVRLVAPAAEWASFDPNRSEAHFGLIDRDRLLLFNESQLRVVRLDLPFHSEEIDAQGTFVGMSGNVACMLGLDALSLVDTVTGKIVQFYPRPETGDDGSAEIRELVFLNGRPIFPTQSNQSSERMQAAVDGPMVYLSGTNGVTCVNAQTAEKIFSTPWPKDVLPPADPPAGAQPGGVSRRQISGSQPAQYLRTGVSMYEGQRYGPTYPLVDRVQDGLLLATPTPTRVVALEAAAAPLPPAAP